MKFSTKVIAIALVLVSLLLAGCANNPPSGGTSGQNGGQLLGSAVNSADFMVDPASTGSGDAVSDLSDLTDIGLTEEDLQ